MDRIMSTLFIHDNHYFVYGVILDIFYIYNISVIVYIYKK